MDASHELAFIKVMNQDEQQIFLKAETFAAIQMAANTDRFFSGYDRLPSGDYLVTVSQDTLDRLEQLVSEGHYENYDTAIHSMAVDYIKRHARL